MRFQSGYLTLITASAVMVLSQPVGAGQVAYEGFGPSFPIYANDGTGFGGPWTQGGFNAFASGYTPLESSLCSAKIKTSGGSVSGTAFSAINGAIRNLAFPLGQNNTTVYVSFLLQPDAAWRPLSRLLRADPERQPRERPLRGQTRGRSRR